MITVNTFVYTHSDPLHVYVVIHMFYENGIMLYSSYNEHLAMPVVG